MRRVTRASTRRARRSGRSSSSFNPQRQRVIPATARRACAFHPFVSLKVLERSSTSCCGSPARTCAHLTDPRQLGSSTISSARWRFSQDSVFCFADAAAGHQARPRAFRQPSAAAAFIIHRLTVSPTASLRGADLQVDQHMLRKVAEAAFVVTISNYNRKFIEDVWRRRAVRWRHPLRRRYQRLPPGREATRRHPSPSCVRGCTRSGHTYRISLPPAQRARP